MRIDRLGVFQRRAGDRHQAVDRNALRRRIELGQLVQQQEPIFLRFAHAQDAAAADVDARRLHGPDGAQPIVVRARGNDVGIVLA